jgi:hypothetical protein
MPTPGLSISPPALALIVGFEVSGEQAYTNKNTRPIWPQGQSGVTVGIGYDVGHHTGEQLRKDWERC